MLYLLIPPVNVSPNFAVVLSPLPGEIHLPQCGGVAPERACRRAPPGRDSSQILQLAPLLQAPPTHPPKRTPTPSVDITPGQSEIDGLKSALPFRTFDFGPLSGND